MYRTLNGLNCPGRLKSISVPNYPIPPELEIVLDINATGKLGRKSQTFVKILQATDALNHVDLSECHYIQLMKMALYMEEYQSNEEMKKRKLFNHTIKKLIVKDSVDILFSIKVEDLDEEHERPWIREGDFVQVTDTKNYNNSFRLRVAKVTQNDIIAIDDMSRLSNVFVETNLYNVTFHFDNFPIRCCHLALWLTYSENVITYMFPRKSKPFVSDERKTYSSLKMLNPSIETNPEQKQAVLNIFNKSSFPAPYIVYGPPGTGKTATLVEAITQIHKASMSNCILVCTPSNTAADEIAKRLLKFVEPSYLYRIYSQSREKSTIDEELRECSFFKGKKKVPLRREDIDGKKILVSTLCTSIRFALMKLNPDYFSHIIIDEAGQGHEVEILIPISAASKDGQLHSQIVLAGDPQQLGPTVMSKLAVKILERSILERLMSYDTYQKDYFGNYNPKYITKLLQNYRSHPKIIHIYNKLFYDDELVAKYSSNDKQVKFPIIFHGVEGVEEKYSYSPSTYNYEEIRKVLTYVYKLIDNQTEFGEVTAKDIGIVTPFKLQSKRIRRILRKKDDEEKENIQRIIGNGIRIFEDDRNVVEKEGGDVDELATEYDKLRLKMQDGTDVRPEIEHGHNFIKYRNFKDINVGTVDLFQGQERKIMIMTAVRSKTFVCNGQENIGFLSHPKRFNVAMSRAKNGLIIIGNPGILQKDHMWQYLLKYCMDNGTYRGFDFELRQPIIDRSTMKNTIERTDNLYKEKPFKLFSLQSADDAYVDEEMSRTIDLFVGPANEDEDEDTPEARAIERLLKSCTKNLKL